MHGMNIKIKSKHLLVWVRYNR